MTSFILRFLLLVSTNAFATTPHTTPVKSSELVSTLDSEQLTKKAREETTAQGVRSGRASEAQLGDQSGILVLKDPGLTPVISPWIFLLGVRAQNFAAGGQATMANGQDFNLSQTNSALYPIVELGIKRRLTTSDRAEWFAALRGDGGYASQATDVTFPSGQKVLGSRLTTSLFGGTLLGSVRLLGYRRFEAELGYSQGVVSYTQSANNDGAGFSKGAAYRGWVAGLLYWPNETFALTLEEARRDTTSDNGLVIPANNLSLGMRAEW